LSEAAILRMTGSRMSLCCVGPAMLLSTFACAYGEQHAICPLKAERPPELAAGRACDCCDLTFLCRP